ncbi:hypothetical protein [Pseudomonas sp. p106]|uniref:hypothetical protein n=1 Tax=Pseudomonas sp. p106 TaxID=2479854 RepID=UPI000F7AB229|nr:hypothetical protein [Pseudomonas sp. p106]RRV45798.1 hypothetical protein EGJ09_12295 [Pseudomonas sp. p106]
MSHLITDPSILEQFATLLFNIDHKEQQSARTQAANLSMNEPNVVKLLLNSLSPGNQLLTTLRDRALNYHSAQVASNPNQNLNDSIAATLHATFTYLDVNPAPQSNYDFEAFEFSLDSLLI